MSPSFLIDIAASLECELDGQPLAVHASEGLIVINVETAKMARALIGHVRRLGKLRSTVARLNAALIAGSHRLELHVDDFVVVAMGRGTDSGFLRFVGLQRVRIWPLRLLQT